MRPSYAGATPYPTAVSTDPAEAETVVFDVPATESVSPEPFNPEPFNPEPFNPEPFNPEPFNPEPFNPEPAPSAMLPAGSDRRIGLRRFTATTPRGNTVLSTTAALGAVVTGGLLAGPACALSTMTAAEPVAPDTALAATALDSLELQPADAETTLPGPDAASPAILPMPSAPGDPLNQHEIEELHKGDALARQASISHADAVRAARVLKGGGNLDDWIAVALQKLGLDPSLGPGVKRIILEESRGNPRAVNRWDSNAMAGRPSQGLMQVIPSTFFSYVLPELAHRPITDPVANITAGIRYMLANYGYATLRAGGRYVNGYYVGY